MWSAGCISSLIVLVNISAGMHLGSNKVKTQILSDAKTKTEVSFTRERKGERCHSAGGILDFELVAHQAAGCHASS